MFVDFIKSKYRKYVIKSKLFFYYTAINTSFVGVPFACLRVLPEYLNMDM